METQGGIKVLFVKVSSKVCLVEISKLNTWKNAHMEKSKFVHCNKMNMKLFSVQNSATRRMLEG